MREPGSVKGPFFPWETAQRSPRSGLSYPRKNSHERTIQVKPSQNDKSTRPTLEQRLAYAASVDQVEAMFSLDGLAPRSENRAIDAAIVAGRVTPQQVREEMVAYVIENKTMQGFIESREWAKFDEDSNG